MKTTLSILLLILSVSAFSQTSNPAPECPIACTDSSNAYLHYISQVTFGPINNISGTTPWPFPHYVFYNNIAPPTFVFGQSYNFNIQIDSVGIDRKVYFWLDWNSNGVLEIAETYVFPVANGMTAVTGSIYIPFSAGVGQRRLRIAYTDNSTPYIVNYCSNNFEWGEIEDYEVNISFTSSTEEYGNADFALHIYPNPVTNSMNLELNNLQAEAVRIYNPSSQVVFESVIENQKQFTMNFDYPAGIYIVSVLTKNGWLNQKLVVER